MTLKKAIAKAWLAFAISLTTLVLFCINASAVAKTTVVWLTRPIRHGTSVMSRLSRNT